MALAPEQEVNSTPTPRDSFLVLPNAFIGKSSYLSGLSQSRTNACQRRHRLDGGKYGKSKMHHFVETHPRSSTGYSGSCNTLQPYRMNIYLSRMPLAYQDRGFTHASFLLHGHPVEPLSKFSTGPKIYDRGQ